MQAQDLGRIGKKDMLTVSGGMNYNAVFYDAQGMQNRRDPFTWYFNGNIDMNFLGVDLPFTYSYTNNHGTYTQPFNMQSCHPHYKWATAHIGTTAMNFSGYTLSGRIFTGAGMELKPANWYVGAMYGRFSKADEGDAAVSFENAAFRRTGCAAKMGYDKNGNALSATFFSAKDDAASLAFIPPEAGISPMENTAMSVSGKITLFRIFHVESEMALSGITKNSLSPVVTTGFSGLEKWMMTTHTTTAFFHAWKMSAGYTGKIFALSLNHERVDPDYETFGAYYFTNDLDNWTLAPSLRLWKGKLTLALNAGVQRNNLDATKINTMHRIVSSCAISFVPSASWMMSFSFSDFTSYTNRRPLTDPFWSPSPADTLNFYQVSQQGNACVMYMFGKKEMKQNFSLSGSYQRSMQQGGAMGTDIYNGNVSYSLQLAKQKMSFSVLGNFNEAGTGAVVSEYFGPGWQGSCSLLKNTLRCSAGTVYNVSLTNGAAAKICSYRAQLSYSPGMKNKKYGRPVLSLNAVYVQRFASQDTGELTVTVNAGYSF
ncbi:MAG TPA: hypothetical protein VFU15_04890 [Bacteroidia bacterium]|nr:hypothetical protein [Bacteroidia bacterium]